MPFLMGREEMFFSGIMKGEADASVLDFLVALCFLYSAVMK